MLGYILNVEKVRFDLAALLFSPLVSNHPFIDGNKRIGIHAMLLFLAQNFSSQSEIWDFKYKITLFYTIRS